MSETAGHRPSLRRSGLGARIAVLLAGPLVLLAFAQPGGGAPIDATAPDGLSLHQANTSDANGVILMLHGGGWRGDLGARADTKMARWIARQQKHGYHVANLAYRTGGVSLADAKAALDFVDARWPEEPICLWGMSAGAQLALMVAAQRGSQVACVVDFAGPPDLENWGGRPGSRHGRQRAVDAFGEARLRRMSPIRRTKRIASPVLVIAAECDRMISHKRQRAFVSRLRRSGSSVVHRVLRKGAAEKVPHCSVNRRSFRRALWTEKRFLRNAMGPEA